MDIPAHEFPGHIQAGGEASGAPWAEATFLTVDDEVVVMVNEAEVARIASPKVTDTGANDVFLIEGADEPLFFRPRDPAAFRATVLPPATTAEKIAAATAASAAAQDATMVMDAVPEPEPVTTDGDEVEDQPSTPALVWWLLAGLAVLILILLVAFCGDGETATSSTTSTSLAGSTTSAPSATTTTVAADTTTTSPATTTTAAATTTTAAATTTTALATTTTSLPEPVFGAGTHVVGQDVDPGTYETGIVTTPLGCEWERLSGTSGAPEDVIAGGEVANHDVVEIMSNDAVFDTNCDAWYDLMEIDPLLSTIPEGTWVLGTHISPGAYTAPGGVDCSWSRLSGLSGTREEVIDGEEPSGAARVEIDPADIAFSSRECGEWSPA